MNIPFVLERTGNGERAYDIYSRLLKDRIIFLGDIITQEAASTIIAQMLFLQLENKEQDIHFYIMSPGGSVTAGLAIYDTMQHLVNDVSTVCIGEACSMGAFLLAAGTKGKRLALPSSRIMIHQIWSGTEGDASSIEIHANEIKRLKLSVNTKLAKHTGQKLEKIERDCDRDFFMSADEARKYGIVDKVLE